MVNYKNGKIYKIVNNVNDLVYYGSTTQPLYKRLNNHKRRRSCNVFKMNVEDNQLKIILVENYSCNNKEELESRERYFIENNNCINKNIPLRTDKEYREDNKEKIKEWRDNNKDYFKNYNKIKINCPCGAIISKGNQKHKNTIKHKNYLFSLESSSGSS